MNDFLFESGPAPALSQGAPDALEERLRISDRGLVSDRRLGQGGGPGRPAQGDLGWPGGREGDSSLG